MEPETFDLPLPPAAGPVLLDGLCPTSEWTAASRTDLGQGVTLLAQKDAAGTHLCLVLPPQSLGAFDLFIAPASGQPINLHSSAQVGQRRRGSDGWWTDPFVWGNHSGWYAPPVRTTDFEALPDGRRAVAFADSPFREMTLTPAVTGAGPWRLLVKIYAVGPDRGVTVGWPRQGDENRPETWAEVR